MNARPGPHLLAFAVVLAAAAGPNRLAAGPAQEPPATPTPSATSPAAPPPRSAAGSQQAGPTQDITGGAGGSLGDIVRKSRAEKESPQGKKKKSLGTITNENLKKDGATKGTLNILPPGSMPVPQAPSASAAGARDAKGRTEEEFRRLTSANRAEQEKAEADVKRLELEVRRLENDFYAWSDGNYRDQVIRPSWDRAREELARARAALDAAVAGRAELEEDARKAGTPPGWLRDK
jgi:hypothetical protein